MSEPIFTCTPDHPWDKEKAPKGQRVQHSAAHEVDSCPDGCCAIMRCATCGHIWQQELPQ